MKANSDTSIGTLKRILLRTEFKLIAFLSYIGGLVYTWMIGGPPLAAGVDEVSLEEFDRDLKNNLYKLWNRMSSGAYFPPVVKPVPIPKKSGGTKTLGVPTVAG